MSIPSTGPGTGNKVASRRQVRRADAAKVWHREGFKVQERCSHSVLMKLVTNTTMTASEMLLRINSGDGSQGGREEREQDPRQAIRTLPTIFRRKTAREKD